MKIEGTIIGYDPGGNGCHGLALAKFEMGEVKSLEIRTCGTANSVLSEVLECPDLIAIGIDTLTCWSTGVSGWRPADRWLKEQYPEITHSIASANSLYGAMGLNGMSVLAEVRSKFPEIVISETHPKVLYYELCGKKYDYKNHNTEMDLYLSDMLASKVQTKNDHEWDAVISIFAVYCGLINQWCNDLHTLETSTDERIVTPCGVTNYWWPK